MPPVGSGDEVARWVEAASGGEVTPTVAVSGLIAALFAEVARAFAADHGPPRSAQGEACRAAVLGQGALARGELAPGGVVGLLMVYETDHGASDGARGLLPGLDLHAYFSRLFARFIHELEALDLVTLDLTRRPEGGGGPLCNSLDALLAYYERFGTAEDRLALVSLVPVAGDEPFAREVMAALGPFVFRRSPDATLVDALRFGSASGLTVQALVDVFAAGHGGRHPVLRAGSTASRLVSLAQLGLLSAADCDALRRRLDQAEGEQVDGHLLEELIADLAPLTSSQAASARGDLDIALDTQAPRDERHAALSRLGLGAPELACDRLTRASRHPDGPFHRRHAARPGGLASAFLAAAQASGRPDQALSHLEGLTTRLRAQPHAAEALARDPARLERLVRVLAGDLSVARHLLGSPALFARLALEGDDQPEPPTQWMARLTNELTALRSDGERASCLRQHLADERTRQAFTGEVRALTPFLEAGIVALACALAGVQDPVELPCTLLVRDACPPADHPPLDLDFLLPDDHHEPGRRLARRLVAAVSTVAGAASARHDRRPFTSADLARHLRDSGPRPEPPAWRVLAGPDAPVLATLAPPPA